MDQLDEHPPMRVFFALWPSGAEAAALAAWLAPLQNNHGGRATAEEKLHNTLVFLGDVETAKMEALQLAAQEVRTAPFQIVLDTARYWGHNHIVYAAPHCVPEKLMALAGKLEDALRLHHFKFDRREYQPHVTLLRKAHFSDKPLPPLKRVPWEVSEFVLVQSVTEGGAVRYEVLARFPLVQH